eukprot:COSAG02_NODE_11_length_58539_cov_103.119473_36_plen_81_part_01
MHLDEKLAMLHGADKEFDDGTLTGDRYVGNVMGNKRLGIPQLNLNDGPQGLRTASVIMIISPSMQKHAAYPAHVTVHIVKS